MIYFIVLCRSKYIPGHGPPSGGSKLSHIYGHEPQSGGSKYTSYIHGHGLQHRRFNMVKDEEKHISICNWINYWCNLCGYSSILYCRHSLLAANLSITRLEKCMCIQSLYDIFHCSMQITHTWTWTSVRGIQINIIHTWPRTTAQEVQYVQR